MKNVLGVDATLGCTITPREREHVDRGRSGRRKACGVVKRGVELGRQMKNVTFDFLLKDMVMDCRCFGR
jgi:hypothetical protein